MKVSIIVPVYNIKDYIQGCVQSLINQTYSDIEIILVNDGSTDGSFAICDAQKKNDNRIKVVHKENGGLSSARNAGLEVATGDFIMFLDGDDYLVHNAVQILIDIQKEYCSDIVQFDYEETECTYHSKFDNDAVNPVFVDDMRTMFDKLYELGGCAASACTKLYHRNLFDMLCFKEGVLHEDEQIIPYVLQKTKSITYIPNKLYCYYMRPGSIIKSGFNIKKLDIFDILNERRNILKNLGYMDLVDVECRRYFTTLLWYWSEAKSFNSKDACKKLRDLMAIFIKGNTVKISGYNKLIYFMCKLNPDCISLYHYMRKIVKGR